MVSIELSKLKISAIAPSDKKSGCYALFADNKLYLADSQIQAATEIADIPNIKTIFSGTGDVRREGKVQIISLLFHHPYVCVTERFGVNGALVNVETGTVKELCREDYHSNVSSYSAGFTEIDGRTLFICQTQWNRLDIYDAATGENRTEREVYCRDAKEKNESGGTIYEYKNYLDYFHSQLTVSPDGRHFLSNGWVWQPYDQLYLFNTEAFLKSYELCRVYADTELSSGYNWDRPCTFIDNNTFVIVLDDAEKSGELDEEEILSYKYYQMAFFKTDAEVHTNKYDHRWMKPYQKIECAAFTPDKDGEVTGKLYYDEDSDLFIALTQDKGTFIISLEGNVLDNITDRKAAQTGVFKNNEAEIGWDFNPVHRVFYTWQDGFGILEKQWNPQS